MPRLALPCLARLRPLRLCTQQSLRLGKTTFTKKRGPSQAACRGQGKKEWSNVERGGVRRRPPRPSRHAAGRRHFDTRFVSDKPRSPDHSEDRRRELHPDPQMLQLWFLSLAGRIAVVVNPCGPDLPPTIGARRWRRPVEWWARSVVVFFLRDNPRPPDRSASMSLS